MKYPKEVIAALIKLGLDKDIDQSTDAGKDAIKAFIAEKNIDLVAITAAAKPIVAKAEPKPAIAKTDDPAAIALKAQNDSAADNVLRIAGINALETTPESKADSIKQNLTLAQAKDAGELANFRSTKAPGIIMAGTETGSEILLAACLLKAGYDSSKMEKMFDSKTLNAADKRRSVSLRGLIADSCAVDGVRAPGINASPEEWIQASFSTSSLGGILSNLANKMMEKGFGSNSDAQAIMQVCRELPLSDLKEKKMYRMFTQLDLPEIPEGGPIPYDTLTEGDNSLIAKTYGKIIAITRKMIINDDLLAFAMIAQKMGRDAMNQFANVGVAMIEDAGSFFSSGNGNLNTGSLVPSEAGYNAMDIAFAAMTDNLESSKLIGAEAKNVIVPAALKTQALKMFQSTNLTGSTTTDVLLPEANVFANAYAPIVIKRLATATTWYGLADPNEIPAFNVGFLNGRKVPTVEEVQMPIEMLGKAVRMVWDFGFATGDYQGAIKFTV